ncbi:MAG: site-specific integrase [Chloroflexales bacterium]|nr:site-specific integrase [Chloroflexales bacterium]
MTELALPPAAAALAQAAAQAHDYAEAAKAPNTRRAYQADWRAFTTWCDEHGRVSLPASPETLILYISVLAESRKVSTIQRRLSSISVAHQLAGHPSPTHDAHVRTVMQGIRRTKGTAPAAKEPAVTKVLKAMIEALPVEAIGVRDRALLLLGFAGAFRRSELVGLDVADVRETSDGLVVTLRASKTDQAGEGMKKGIPYGSTPRTCPVRALRAWKELAGLTAGPLFRPINRHGQIRPQRLTGHAVATIVKRAATLAGLDPAHFSGHSLRAGLATAAAQAGVSERVIMQQTGHKSLPVLRRYIREGSLFRENAAAQVGL